jgi:hyaluronoglucosaminidase
LSACGGGSTATVTPAPTTYSAYALNFGDGTMTPFELDSGIPGTPITVGTAMKVYALASTPDGKTAYVAEEGSVRLFSLPHGVLSGASIATPTGDTLLAMAPDGKTAYLGNYNAGTLTPIDIASNKLGTPMMAVASLTGLVIAKDSKTAYVATLGNGSVTPIDLVSKQAGAAIAVGVAPAALALSPDGKTLYVSVAAGVVSVSLMSGTVGTVIPIGFRTAAIAVSPDGKTLYLANFVKNEVDVLDLTTKTLGAPTPTGTSPVSITVAKDRP